MAYSHTSFADAKAALALRLQDSGKVFWIDAELGALIKEALQFWAVAALYFRDRVGLNTVVGSKFYDVAAALNGAGTATLARSTTDRNLVNALQYSLLENVNDFSSSSIWAGTSMFVMADLQNALQRRLNQLLYETGSIVTESQQIVTSGNGRVDLAQTTVDIIRAAWVSLDNSGNESTITRLSRMDELTAGRQQRGWTANPSRPQGYSIDLTNSLQLQLIPAPSDSGKLHLLTVNDNADLDVTTGVVISLPNDLTQVVTWGARADLLSSDGQARDPERAAYCEKRWREGLELAKIYPTVMNAQINGLPAQLCSIDAFDNQFYRWQSTSGRPSVLAMAGLNLLTMNRVPDGIYSITMDVNCNAVLPSIDGDFIQVGKELIDVILDYAEHLALFKCAGMEWQATMPLYERTMKAAAEYNSKLAANAQAFDVLATRQQAQYRDSPRRQVA